MPTDGQFSRDSILTLPKAEIHIHVEGCFDADELARLATEAGEPLPRPKEKLFQFDGLSSFLEFLDWSCGLIRTEEQLEELGYSFCQRLAQSGTQYCDAIINPTHWGAWRGRLRGLIDGLDRGFAGAERDGLTPVKLCVSLLRGQTASEAIELVEFLLQLRHPRVVALSIDGNEARAGRTGPRFEEAFRRAKEGGLRITVHAGESSGPEGVWDAIELLKAERIDHGVRAIEDAKLVKILSERQIPLGICPTSNLIGKLYPELKEHPLEKLRRAGIPVSVNTDDPGPLGLTLAGEYEKCAAAFEWSEPDLRAVAKTSIEASFADVATKERLLGELDRWQISR
jgi:adenosine deaminase